MRSSRGNIAEPRAKLTTLLLATRYNRAMVIHRRLFWLFLVALLAGCASTPRPRPQTPTRIATIVPLDDNAIPTARALRDALNGQTAHVASVEQALGDAPRSAPSSQAVAPTQRAHAALQQAHQAYQQLRFRDALEVLTSAQQALVAAGLASWGLAGAALAGPGLICPGPATILTFMDPGHAFGAPGVPPATPRVWA